LYTGRPTTHTTHTIRVGSLRSPRTKTGYEAAIRGVLQLAQQLLVSSAHATNAHIQVVYNPYGSKDLQKVRRLIREAKDQLPTNMRSIIVLETLHTKRMVNIAEEKLKHPGYENVIVVLVVGDGAWSVPNPLQSGFPLEFVKTAVLPNPI